MVRRVTLQDYTTTYISNESSTVYVPHSLPVFFMNHLQEAAAAAAAAGGISSRVDQTST